MYTSLRTRLLLALSLACVGSSAACKKEDDAQPTGVDGEGKPKKTKTPAKKIETWTLPGSATAPTMCSHVDFCTTGRPKVTYPSDASALYVECGSSVRVPKEVLLDGFSDETSASFIEYVTKEQREKKDPEACCYGYQTGPCGKGRPLRDGDSLVLAPEVVGDRGWAGVDVSAAAREVTDVDAFVDWFRRVARLEHGSVAAFAMVSLELMALGAPADLVEAAHVAALDEIRHTRVCYSLLEALGTHVGPGALSLPPWQPIDRERVLTTTIVDGCVGETLGSLCFYEAAARANDRPALSQLFRTIADEEARHAELAFRIARFIIGDDERLAELARDAALGASRTPTAGGLPLDVQREVLNRGFTEVVMPLVQSIAA